ncbi:hypothetical protein [Methanobrevibacter sp. 87.7]|uniref:hypothetical protein n=1 Tax=Methanobrevibacter sp. 87.7 TaxID=387957 RepID=UPI00117CB9BE|nr:hypothetical protein [Methanobrevibacter sp. 87.7]
MIIIDYIKSLSDVFGIANLSDDKERLINNYGDDICKYPYAIAIGHRMKEEIINKIPLTYNDDKLAKEYQDEYFNSHKRVLKISEKIGNFIKNNGYHAIVLGVKGNNKEIKLKKPFSNKASAHISGVG